MRLLAIASMCALVVGCNQRQPRLTDAQVKELKAAEPGFKDECVEKMRWGGPEALTGEQEDCYKLDPPQRWKGLVYGAFETARFCPQPARECSDDTPGETIWLGIGPSVELPPSDGDIRPAVYAVDFIGRKTSFRRKYGAQGYDQEIMVDRLISMKKIEVLKK